MIVTLVYIKVIPDHIEEFIAASRLNQENSTKEKGNIRFDIIQKSDDPSVFVFYEVFENDEAINAHKLTAHYLQWKATVEPWMEVPRNGVRYEVRFPRERDKW